MPSGGKIKSEMSHSRRMINRCLLFVICPAMATLLLCSCHQYQLYTISNGSFLQDDTNRYIHHKRYGDIIMSLFGVIVDKSTIKIEVSYTNDGDYLAMINPINIQLTSERESYDLINIYINDRKIDSVSEYPINPYKKVEIVYRFMLPQVLRGQVPDLKILLGNIVMRPENRDIEIDPILLRKYYGE